MMGVRSILNVLLFISILFLPWWVALAFAFVLLMLYPAFEILIWGLFFDSLYGTPVISLYSMQYLATYLMFIMLLISFFVKREIIFYQQ